MELFPASISLKLIPLPLVFEKTSSLSSSVDMGVCAVVVGTVLIGASLTGLTCIEAVSMKVLKALLPPLEVSNVLPLLPAIPLSQAR